LIEGACSTHLKTHTYTQGTLICGGVGVVIAVFLPFTILEDMISAGVLVAFNMTNTGLMLHRRQHATRPALPRWLALGFNALALAAAFLWCVSSVCVRWLNTDRLGARRVVKPTDPTPTNSGSNSRGATAAAAGSPSSS